MKPPARLGPNSQRKRSVLARIVHETGARLASKALARRAHGLIVLETEAEVVDARQLRRDRIALGEREPGPVARTEHQQMLVVMDPPASARSDLRRTQPSARGRRRRAQPGSAASAQPPRRAASLHASGPPNGTSQLRNDARIRIGRCPAKQQPTIDQGSHLPRRQRGHEGATAASPARGPGAAVRLARRTPAQMAGG